VSSSAVSPPLIVFGLQHVPMAKARHQNGRFRPREGPSEVGEVLEGEAARA